MPQLTHFATMMLERAALGAIVAGAVAFVAQRARSLSPSGALAATAVGTAAIAASWHWGALLIAYFVASALLSRVGRMRKEQLTSGVLAKSGERDATQVIANGGIFAASILLSVLAVDKLAVTLSLAALGALAAAAADTWATEIGTLFGGTPRSLLTMRPVPPGSSGGVSVAGSLAMIAGAAFVAGVAMALDLTDDMRIVAVAGMAGAIADSVIGATVQERRWCAACDRGSEQRRHNCGSSTRLVGGREWMDNDMVNLIATFVGAAVAVLLAYV
ncbi:MAG: DUF92 domain-containing protein [Gemmatimonadaceae bacterium]